MGGNATERTRTEDGVESARQGAEGEGGKEGADLLGGARRRRDTEWEYLCEWEGEQSDTWVWHDRWRALNCIAVVVSSQSLKLSEFG